jgi:hypothetical protein
MKDILNKIFTDLRKHPGWHVCRGYGSFITFNFGKPRLKECGIHKRTGKGRLPRQTRMVSVRGDWHLWIYCCAWVIWQDGKHAAGSGSSNDEVDCACAFLNGQKIRGITIYPKTGETLFSFDLGGAMLTWPMDDAVIEQWSLRCPKDKILQFRSDGTFAYSDVNSPPNKEKFVPINAKIVIVGLMPLYAIPRKRLSK